MGFIKTNTNKVKQQVVTDSPRKKGPQAPFMKFPPNRTVTIRVLPPWTDKGECAEQPYKRIEQHWGVGAKELRVNCPHGMSNGADPCYVCEQIDLLKSTGDPGDAKIAGDIKASRRYVYQVIDRADPLWHEDDPEVAEFPNWVGTPKIKIATVGWMIHKALTDFITNPRWTGFDDALQGNDVDVKRVGSKKEDTEYSLMPHRENTPIFANEDGSPNMDLINIIGGYEEDGVEVPGTLIDLDWKYKPTTYISSLMIYHGFAPWEEEDKTAFGQLVESGQIHVPAGHQLENKKEEESAGSLPQGHQQKQPMKSLPPAPNPLEQRLNDWRKRVSNGLAIQDRGQLLAQAHREGRTEITAEQLSPEVLKCYSQEVSPMDDYCVACLVAHHCSATFQSQTGLEWLGGQPLRPAAPPSTGKPVGKGLGRGVPQEQSYRPGQETLPMAVNRPPHSQAPQQQDYPQTPVSSMPMPPAGLGHYAQGRAAMPMPSTQSQGVQGADVAEMQQYLKDQS